MLAAINGGEKIVGCENTEKEIDVNFLIEYENLNFPI